MTFNPQGHMHYSYFITLLPSINITNPPSTSTKVTTETFKAINNMLIMYITSIAVRMLIALSLCNPNKTAMSSQRLTTGYNAEETNREGGSNLNPPGQYNKSPHQSNGDLPWGTRSGQVQALENHPQSIRGRVVGSNTFSRPFMSKSWDTMCLGPQIENQ